MDDYDIDIKSSGSGWMGTFHTIIEHTANNILEDNAPWRVAVTLYDDKVVEGMLTGVVNTGDTDMLVVNTEAIDIEDVVRFRA